MSAYIARRILLMIPTLLGILFVSFVVVQFAPGGPVERVIAQLSGADTGGSSRISGGGDFAQRAPGQLGAGGDAVNSKYRGAQGLDPDFIKKLEKQFGFDKPAPERFALMVWNFARFDFGNSYFRDVSVLQLVKEKLPVSISLGIWLTLLTYLISIPLGIRKAVQDGTRFDTWTSSVLVLGYAIPGFLFAILLIILFAGGSFFNWFPLRGLTSDGWSQFPWYWKIIDYFWHLTLPLIAMGLGAFTTMTFLTKNSFLDEIRKQYVMTARAKGCGENRVLYGHVFRNAMLIVIAGFPSTFIHAFFSGSLLIETIFSLDGLGLLSFESVLNRDYPVVFGTLFIFSLVGLVINLISDPYLHVDRSADRFRGAGGLMTLAAPTPIETTAKSPLGDAVPITRKPFVPSPLNRRRWQNFKANRRGYWSFWIFMILFVVSLFAELIANDRPFLIKYDGHLYWPAFVTYSETTFGGDFETAADYRDPYLQKLIKDKGGSIVWPLIRYSYDTHNLDLPTPAPSPPTWMLTEAQCKPVVEKKGLKSCRDLEYNWLGTDDQGRDVVARLIYGFRISVLFGLCLTIVSSVVGIAAGAVQGYFGGWVDLLFQRFIEIWTAIPSLYLLLILSSVLVPGFFVLLGILLLFSWVSLVGLVRAEFLRGRNFEYIQAARALGVSNAVIMFKHLLPNAMVATMTFLPFIVSSSVMTLTALDFLGFGLPPGSPSLGELLSQGKSNVQAPWLGFSGFFSVAIMLSLLIFIGEAVRDAFDPRKTFK
ncbi:ABC-type microcin C transport system permease subunit YejB [Bradyrhizobium japonicum]